MVGLWICIRDDVGKFVLAKMACYAPLCNVDVGEVVGLHTTLEWVPNLQFDYVDFPLDSKKVTDQVRSYIDDNSEFGCIISACKSCYIIVFRTLMSS